jgi:hypothetical protein
MLGGELELSANDNKECAITGVLSPEIVLYSFEPKLLL